MDATRASSESENATVAPGSEEIVVRIRRRRKQRADWYLPRATGWAARAVAGDATLILFPAFALVAGIIAVLAVGAPGRPEVLVPFFVPPPADSFQDIGIVSLAGHTGWAMWVARILFAAARTIVFGGLCALAAQRACDAPVTLNAARARMNLRTLLGLGALSFGFALLVSEQGSLDAARDAALSATALTVAMLVLPGAFVSAALGSGFWRSLGSGLLFPKPLGHLVLVFGYSAAINGMYRLAAFGESGRVSALPVTLYSFVAALLTAVFVCALARRYREIRGPAAQAPGNKV